MLSRCSIIRGLCVAVVASLGAFVGIATLGAAEPTTSPEGLLGRFTEGWNEAEWDGGGVPGKRKFMRPLDDRDWQLRMRVLHGLVAAGQTSVAPLIETLRSGQSHERVLAAQALSYLAPLVPTEPLWAAATDDPDAAVRLYAVDALGMRGDPSIAGQLSSLAATESNGDVKKHIAYAIDRQDHPIDPSIVDQFTHWDPANIASAQVGEPAPDFTLKTIDGQEISLSDFRGQQAVVLVFIYGDT